MNKEQLNRLVYSYQNGDELALVGIFDAVNPLIEKASKDIELVVENYTKFDCRIVVKVKKLIETFEYGKHDFIGAVKAIIGNERAFLYKRAMKKPKVVSKDAMEESTETSAGTELRDKGLSIEDNLVFKEKITLLAQGDPRKKVILEQWSRGATDVSISELLAQRFGGKDTSHWRYIMRFKEKCRSLLAEADAI